MELTARTPDGARLVATAERLAEDLATRSAGHNRDGSDPFEGIDALRAAGYFAAAVPAGLGLHVDTFISASLDPPLVAFAPSRGSLTWRRIRRHAVLGISVLGAQHAAGLRERARPGADTLAGLDVELLRGVPVVRDALAILLCAPEAEHPAGDHTLALLRVLEVRDGSGEVPLVSHRGTLGGALPAVYRPPV